MYAYEAQCEDERANCFYPTVNKFLGRDHKDLLYCMVWYGMVLICNVLHCIALHCIVYMYLYCIVLYCIVLYMCTATTHPRRPRPRVRITQGDIVWTWCGT